MFHVRQPKICLIVHNRHTRYNRLSAKAYSSMAGSISKVVFSAYERHKQMFEEKPGLPSSTYEPDVDTVALNYFVDVQDFHTVGVVALHIGYPLANVRSSLQIPVLQGTVSVNLGQLDTYKKCLQNVVVRLCPQTCGCNSND